MGDKRSKGRHRVYKAGKIIFNEHRSVTDRVLKDISDMGAKLKLASPMALPKAFELRLVSEHRTIKVRRTWRPGDLVGVTFISDD